MDASSADSYGANETRIARESKIPAAPRWVEVRSITDPDLRARAEQVLADARERARLALAPPPFQVPNPRRHLCGCVDPEIGPSVVRDDGSCAACSP